MFNLKLLGILFVNIHAKKKCVKRSKRSKEEVKEAKICYVFLYFYELKYFLLNANYIF